MPNLIVAGEDLGEVEGFELFEGQIRNPRRNMLPETDRGIFRLDDAQVASRLAQHVFNFGDGVFLRFEDGTVREFQPDQYPLDGKAGYVSGRLNPPARS